MVSKWKFGWLLLAGGFLVAMTLSPREAFAQDAEIKRLVNEATNNYDTLQIKAAEQKLEKAINMGESQGASGAVVAKAYVMLGIVRYGATRDKKAALKAFKQAISKSADAEIPPVYQTPTLEKLMKEARKTAKPKGGGEEQKGVGTGPQRDVDKFTHEPIASAKAGKALLVEAFVPKNMPAASVYFIFKRYNASEWHQAELSATNATRFAVEVPGYRIHTSQVSYYLEAVDSSGNVIARSGAKNRPHNITVLGSSGFDPEKAKKEYMERKRRREAQRKKRQEQQKKKQQQKEKQKQAKKGKGDGKTDTGKKKSGPSGPVVYFDFGGGTGVGFLPGGGQPTANPGRGVQPGLAPAFGHLRLGAGGMISSSAQLGLYFRWQFSPAQDFQAIREQNGPSDYTGFQNGECLGIGLAGDCLLGLKYRWFFSDEPGVRVFSSIGAGFGRVRHWLRLKERESSSFCDGKTIISQPGSDSFCYRRDTVRPGWIHFGVGGGASIDLNETFALIGEAYLEVLFPDTAINIDFNVGPQFRF